MKKKLAAFSRWLIHCAYAVGPSRLKVSWLIGYPLLGIAAFGLLIYYKKTGFVAYLWDGFKDPGYEHRILLIVYVIISVIASAVITGAIIWKLFVWAYRKIPLPTYRWYNLVHMRLIRARSKEG